MRSTLLIGCFLWAVLSVHSLTRIDRHASIQKRSPQIYQGQQGSNLNQSQQFQWVKVNNQWVKKDGTNKLPGYSDPNVPYNQAGSHGNTPAPNRSPSQPQPGAASNAGNQAKPGQQQPAHVPAQRQDSTSSQGSIGWNPSADRALTEDRPKTTPHPTTTSTTTTTTTRAPAHKPAVATPPPVRAPFGSGMGGQQKPQRYNPDASLTYGGLAPQSNPNKAPVKPTPTGRPGSNPWGGLTK